MKRNGDTKVWPFRFFCIFKTKMTKTETLLWNSIEAFQIDETDVSLTFSQRLARENGWNKNYALRVIEEYKKFLFLCCVSTTPVTPSDPVDQAWHLHLTYTKSYWNNLCKNTLKREVHHNPTKGGKTEQDKFYNLYGGLQQIYFQKFSSYPPTDIWHDNDTRFSDVNFQRVNLSNYWLVKKPGKQLKPILLTLFAIITGILCIQAKGIAVFIIIFVILTIAAVIQHFKDGDNNQSGGASGNGSDTSFWSSSDGHHHDGHSDSGCSSHHGHGGCSSGCSGGCSGCGSGCGGGD